MLPNIKLPKRPEYEISVWGNRRRQYLKQYHRIKYYNMLTQCTRYPHLADIEQQAMFDRLVNQLAENQILWIQRMNNIRSRAMEIVNTELIYA